MTKLQSALTDSCYDAARKMSYIALDVDSWDRAAHLIDELGDSVDGYKVGLELFHAEGPTLVEKLCAAGKRVFLDVKLHDIPNTVARALNRICQYPIEMVNVHTLGGPDMLNRARAAVDSAPYHPLLIGVTILTSMTEESIHRIGIAENVSKTVDELVRLALAEGLDGVVASALEIQQIRQFAPSGFEIVVPGTRPRGGAVHDQARSATPGEAVLWGASRLVLGRAVTESPDPVAALQKIWDEMLTAKS